MKFLTTSLIAVLLMAPALFFGAETSQADTAKMVEAWVSPRNGNAAFVEKIVSARVVKTPAWEMDSDTPIQLLQAELTLQVSQQSCNTNLQDRKLIGIIEDVNPGSLQGGPHRLNITIADATHSSVEQLMPYWSQGNKKPECAQRPSMQVVIQLPITHTASLAGLCGKPKCPDIYHDGNAIDQMLSFDTDFAAGGQPAKKLRVRLQWNSSKPDDLKLTPQ